MTQKEALQILKMGHNVYLTGSAGSGKTYVLNQYINHLREHEVEVGITASTGIAATHMNGVTIHSWCGTGIRTNLSDYEIEALEEKQYLWNRFKKTKVLIIDEISMLHAEHLDLVERICRSLKRSDEPFGGLQVILCGDFFQLPPVSKTGEDITFIYQSNAWKEMNLKVCYLEEQHRQGDKVFVELLNKIRSNDIDDDMISLLKERTEELEGDIRPTKLFTHNIDVDAINEEELQQLPGGSKVYTMVARGNPFLVETLKKSCLAPETLGVKPGAQVMFVKNNFEAGYVNGTLGTVVNFEKDGTPMVRTFSGKLINATPVSWSIEEDGKVKAEISQIPLRLAWAITIHKSQGMSLDAAEVDLTKSFVPGQGYVALSRVRSLKGLRLLGFNNTALTVDENIYEFDIELKKKSEKNRTQLKELTESVVQKAVEHFILQSGGTLTAQKVDSHLNKKKPVRATTHEETKKLLEQELDIMEIATRRGVTAGTVMDHIEKLIEDELIDPLFDLEHLKPKDEVLKVISQAFKQTGETKLTPVFKHLKGKFTYDDLRVARFFIK
jgi:hypothetical protein